jgi:hypothetical protein
MVAARDVIPAPDDIKILRGERLLRSRGRKAEDTRAGPMTFVARVVVMRSFRELPVRPPTAALLISTSRQPKCSLTKEAAAAIEASSVTSRWRGVMLVEGEGFVARIDSVASSAAVRLREVRRRW